MKSGENRPCSFREEDALRLQDFISVYSSGAKANNSQGTKF